ncbi:MAG: LOG family protein [Cyanobacteria bacterium]|nr:LOG family protein [Cyanobacteriota bacterium]
MAPSFPVSDAEHLMGRDALRSALLELVDRLPAVEHGSLIQEALTAILELAATRTDRLDWKILVGSLQDLQRGVEAFYDRRAVRKVTLFGSARLSETSPEYAIAREFAQRIVERGFMVLTGAGGGIMQAGNEGAGAEHSFGLNIDLPFEQTANPFIDGDEKLIDFKYFFIRKLFFLRESDGVVLCPGGFGTQDEAFECLTLLQTGKFGPAPVVLLDRPGGSYWHEWELFHRDHLAKAGLISPEDLGLYTLTDEVAVACDAIANFYRIYHSSRYVGDRLVLRLRADLTDEAVEELNHSFSDIVTEGRIEKTAALPAESQCTTAHLPRLVLSFDRVSLARLHQLVHQINRYEPVSTPRPDFSIR